MAELALASDTRNRSKLHSFLLGTLDPKSPLRILRGQEDVLRIIWSYACSEWWSLHIEHYVVPHLPQPSHFERDSAEHDFSQEPDLRRHDLFKRKMFLDCPYAVVGDVVFPPPAETTDGQPVHVNMMPFDLMRLRTTVPAVLHGYLPLIKKCRLYVRAHIDREKRKRQDADSRVLCDPGDMRQRVAYLTVDERPVSAGESQRRGGVHVESPGAMRPRDVADKSQYTPDLAYYHPWGMGRAMDEFLEGGIFLASNTADSTAVWNCRVHDTFGDIIGPHGSLERLRDVLGPPTKALAAGELVWLSDRTPHESLPLRAATRRQFFRLVVGEIGFWFPQHCTANPTGFRLPRWVPVVDGDKFAAPLGRSVVWEPGDADEIRVARAEEEFRNCLYRHGVGFLADDLLRRGVYDAATFGALRRPDLQELIAALDAAVYSVATKSFVSAALQHVRFELTGTY